MRFFKARPKLPHLPIDEPLPQFVANPAAGTELYPQPSYHQPTSRQSLRQPIPQLLLAKELKQINMAIADLRLQHQQLKGSLRNPQRRGSLKNIPSATSRRLQRHQPARAGLDGDLAYYEEELGAIQQELLSLRTTTFRRGIKISSILPTPPLPITVLEKTIVKRTALKKTAADQNLIRQKQRPRTFLELAGELADAGGNQDAGSKRNTGSRGDSSSNLGPEPKKLLEKLKYGVIELQQKWAEVQNRLQAIESYSPEVSRQLQQLDLELNQLEKMALESPHVVTDVPWQQGLVRELSAESRKRAKREITEKLSGYTEDSMSVLRMNKAYHQVIREYSPARSKFISYASPQPGRSAELPLYQRTEARKQVKAKLAGFKNNQQIQHQLKEVQKELSSDYVPRPGKIILVLEQYQGRAKTFDDAPKQVLRLQRELAKRIRESKFLLRKTTEIKEIDKQLGARYQPPKVRYNDLTPVLPEDTIRPSKSARKRAKKEIRKSLAAIEQSLPRAALDDLANKLSAAKNYCPPKVKVASELYSQPYRPLPYRERERFLAKEWQRIKQEKERQGLKQGKKDTAAVELSPELISLNQKIDQWSKGTTAAKAKVVLSWPKSRDWSRDSSKDLSNDPSPAGLERELKETQNILALVLKNPALLLGRLSKRMTEPGQSLLEQKAKREAQVILAKINVAASKPDRELLRINDDLRSLTQAPIQIGKKITRMHTRPVISGMELEVLDREKIAMEKKLAGAAMPEMEKSPELLAVEQQLAELYLE